MATNTSGSIAFGRPETSAYCTCRACSMLSPLTESVPQKCTLYTGYGLAALAIVVHMIVAVTQGGQMTPIDLVVEEYFHRAAPGGMGGTKAAGNYSPVSTLTAQSNHTTEQAMYTATIVDSVDSTPRDL